jgi:hypothetical protein
MARIEIHKDRIVIQLSASEKLAAFRTRDVVLDRSRISQAIITDDPWIFARGVYTRGTHIPGRSASGVWRHLGGRDFLLVRRGRESLVLDIHPPSKQSAARADTGQMFSEFARVVVGTQHAAEIIATLNLSGGDAETTRQF